MQYRVHVFAVVRVPVTVEAESQSEAIRSALDSADWYSYFAQGENEFAEEFSHFLVDEVGDEQYSKSTWYEADGATVLDDRTRLAILEERTLGGARG